MQQNGSKFVFANKYVKLVFLSRLACFGHPSGQTLHLSVQVYSLYGLEKLPEWLWIL
jgi:hypothetical protein